MKKKLLITIDTEGDNLWAWKNGDPITTENTLYLERFQSLCEKYGFIPCYLTNYEMANDERFVTLFKEKRVNGLCEIGMHLHAWNTPPEYPLENIYSGAPYLIEYPYEMMEQKIATMTKLLSDVFEFEPKVHRAGRWAMNDDYFSLLDKYGYRVDCSIAAGMNFSTSAGATLPKGPDFSDCPDSPYLVENTNVLEIPLAVKNTHRFFLPEKFSAKGLLRAGYATLKGQSLWLRPNGHNKKQMAYLIKKGVNRRCNYLMFMLHSSEFMPGGSPTFKTKEDIERLYEHLEYIFSLLAKEYEGCSLENYAKEFFKA